MPHGTNISKPTEEKAIRLADRRLRLIDAELEAIRVKQEVFDFIDNIDGVEGEVLKYRYVDLLTWEEICIRVHYSWRQTHRIHRRALAIVTEMMA